MPLLASALAVAACQKHRASDLAPTSSTAPSASARRAPAALGTPAVTPHFRMTAVSVQRCAPSRLHAARAHYYVLGVLVRIEALSHVGIPVNPFYARLVDADGVGYRARLDGCKPALGGPPLAWHRSASGFISFEVPEKASGLELRYAPELPGARGEELDFALGR